MQLTATTQELLSDTAAYLVNPPKGILAADESAKTCCKRFDDVHLECSEESRRAFREMIIMAPRLENLITGIILTDETIRQSTKAGERFAQALVEKGIKPGIKVDEGLTGYRSEDDTEFVTKGIDGLPERILKYKTLGAAFSKWRAAYSVAPGLPTTDALAESVKRMREYAIICHEHDIVPIVEPEVLMDGKHTIAEMDQTLRIVIKALMADLVENHVYMPGLILKTSMALSGKHAEWRADATEVAERTVAILKELVPEDIGGVIFLSGGQSHSEANLNYDAIMRRADKLSFPMTFSFSRAFQNESLAHYAKNPRDVAGSQKILIDNIQDVADL